MALKPLQATMPLGQFDGLDAILTTLKGGECVTFSQVTRTGTDKAAADSFDGYEAATFRPVINRYGYATGVSAAPILTTRPLMLADEGIAGYGTLFGTVVGGTVGQVSTGGAVLGPHTTSGSGKVTCWSQPGLYAVSIDAVDATLQPTAATPVAAGTALYATLANDLTTSGLLTTTAGSNGTSVGNFVEFATNGSLVTTPNNLVGTFNPPDGALTTTSRSYTWVVLYFNA
jgi:hypothetical protein